MAKVKLLSHFFKRLETTISTYKNNNEFEFRIIAHMNIKVEYQNAIGEMSIR